MADQWPRKAIKLNNGIALPRSFLRNQKTAPLERARSGLFTAIFSFGTALVIEKIRFEIFSHIPTWYYIKRLLATTRPAVGIQILEIPTAKNSDFKLTPHVLQVSSGAQTECKTTARVPSFDSPEKIDCATQSLMSNLRKTRFLTVSEAFLSVTVSPTRNFF